MVPQPLSASANVLVMTYCPGVKVTDPKGGREHFSLCNGLSIQVRMDRWMDGSMN